MTRRRDSERSLRADPSTKDSASSTSWMMRSAAANDGLRLRVSVAVRGPSSATSFRARAAPCHVMHTPDRSEIDTQSDTLRSGRPCDSWTPLDAKVREFLSKTHRWTPSDAGGTAETNLVIRVSLVRSQRGPPIESTTYGASRIRPDRPMSALCQQGAARRSGLLTGSVGIGRGDDVVVAPQQAHTGRGPARETA